MKKITILFFVAVFGLWTGAFAQSQDTAEDSVTKKRNPFSPQLPVEKKAPKPKPVEVKPKKPEIKKPAEEPKIKPRDPKPTLSTTLPSVTITGIIWNSHRPQAIINGRVVDIGDTIEDMKIIAIRKTGIDVSFRGASKTLRVY